MDAQLKLVLSATEVSRELLERDVKKVIKLADMILERRGGVVLDSERPVSWRAMNQFTRQEETLELPGLSLGDGHGGAA